MNQPKMNVKTYLAQFNVVDKDNKVYDILSQTLYSAILNKFKISITGDEYYYFREYQERVFDLVENLRELSVTNIGLILTHINKQDHYLVDNVIMLWCVPRIDSYRSKKMYQKRYGNNIARYSGKICSLIDHAVVKNFCVETLTKNNNVPIDCIDYLWYYMAKMTMELSFYNGDNGDYLGIEVLKDGNTETDPNGEIRFGLNMEYLLGLGLGAVTYKHDPHNKGSFRSFLKTFILDTDAVALSLKQSDGTNLKAQLLAISTNVRKYFGEDFVLPIEIVESINK